MKSSPRLLAVVLGCLVFGIGSSLSAQPYSDPQPPPPPPPGPGYTPAVQPVPQAYGPYRTHHGLTIGFGFGAGFVTCDGCGDSTTEVAFDFHVGGFLNPRLALMYDVAGIVDSEDGFTAVLATNTIAVQYWVAPQFWVKGGLGVSQARISGDFGSDSEYGVGATFAGGFEIIPARRSNFALDIGARLSHLDFDELQETLQMFTVILGARWR